MAIIVEVFMVWFQLLWCCLKAMVGYIVPTKKKSVAGEVVLVTGAGSGIGRLMSINFAKQGATLVLWDVNKEGNDETVEQIQQLGGKAHSYVVDVTKKDVVYRVAEQVTKDVGNVTILINNAGVVAGKNLLDCPDELIERSMNVNAMAMFWTIKAFGRSMYVNNHGHIVTIASLAGSIGTPGMVEYCASKFAAVGLHESLYYEFDKLGATGVHMTLVQPWWIDTGMFDGFAPRKGVSPPALQPQYVADKVLHAVQTNQEVLMLPRDGYIIPVLKSLMPASSGFIIGRFSGTYSAMDNFVGRSKKQL